MTKQVIIVIYCELKVIRCSLKSMHVLIVVLDPPEKAGAGSQFTTG